MAPDDCAGCSVSWEGSCGPRLFSNLEKFLQPWAFPSAVQHLESLRLWKAFQLWGTSAWHFLCFSLSSYRPDFCIFLLRWHKNDCQGRSTADVGFIACIFLCRWKPGKVFYYPKSRWTWSGNLGVLGKGTLFTHCDCLQESSSLSRLRFQLSQNTKPVTSQGNFSLFSLHQALPVYNTFKGQADKLQYPSTALGLLKIIYKKGFFFFFRHHSHPPTHALITCTPAGGIVVGGPPWPGLFIGSMLTPVSAFSMYCPNLFIIRA